METHCLIGQEYPVHTSDTKYRDIADGNLLFSTRRTLSTSAVRYQVPRYSGWKLTLPAATFSVVLKSDTKYRDIADGNADVINNCQSVVVRYQVPRYSGWKLHTAVAVSPQPQAVRYQVPRYSGWKR